MPGWTGQGDHFNLVLDGLGSSSAGEAAVHGTCRSAGRRRAQHGEPSASTWPAGKDQDSEEL